MDEAYLLLVTREGLYLALLLSAPPLLAILAVGLLTSALQTVTQLQEPSLGHVPRVAAAGAALLVAGPWIGEQLVRFTQVLLGGLSAVGP